MPLDANDTRSHGWQRPFHPLQIVGISVFCLLVLLFYLFPGILLGNRVAEITVNTIFSFVAVSSALLFIRCSAIDPGDTTRFRFRNKRNRRNTGLNYGYIFSRILLRFLRSMERKILRSCIRRKYLDPSTTRIQMEPIFPFHLVQQDDSVTPNPKDDEISFCYLCDFEVNRYSKHCRTCNRCVEGFDHHCRWLNNCVGKKNYTTFFLLMVLVLIMLVIEAGAALAVFIRCFAYSKGIEEELNSRHYRNFPRSVIATLCVFIVVITSYVMAALGQLLFFHVLLIKKGISTYDFILAMKEENKSLEFESLEDTSDFSSDDDEEEDLVPEKSKEGPFPLSWMMCNIRRGAKTKKTETQKNTGSTEVTIDPWKLTNLKWEEALLAREKALLAREKALLSHNQMVGRDPLKPLPLEMKSGLLIKPDKDSSVTTCLPEGKKPFNSPGKFSSPRKRIPCSIQHSTASPDPSPTDKYKSDFDLKLTKVSRELETHISRQVLCCVLKKQDSPR